MQKTIKTTTTTTTDEKDDDNGETHQHWPVWCLWKSGIKCTELWYYGVYWHPIDDRKSKENAEIVGIVCAYNNKNTATITTTTVSLSLLFELIKTDKHLLYAS